jgi:hypothetical protein
MYENGKWYKNEHVRKNFLNALMKCNLPRVIIMVIKNPHPIIWKSFLLFSNDLLKEILPRFIRFGSFWNFISIFGDDIK